MASMTRKISDGAPGRTVLDEQTHLEVTSEDNLVILWGDWPPDGAWEFTPTEARALASALTAHAARAEAGR